MIDSKFSILPPMKGKHTYKIVKLILIWISLMLIMGIVAVSFFHENIIAIIESFHIYIDKNPELLLKT